MGTILAKHLQEHNCLNFSPSQTLTFKEIYHSLIFRDIYIEKSILFQIPGTDQATYATVCIPALFKSPQTTTNSKLKTFSTWMNKHGDIAHVALLYSVSILLIYLPMGVVLRYIIFSEYAQVSVAVYMWYSLAGCVVGLLFYWILINLYYRVSTYYNSFLPWW